jgi:hypothetical protein
MIENFLSNRINGKYKIPFLNKNQKMNKKELLQNIAPKKKKYIIIRNVSFSRMW